MAEDIRSLLQDVANVWGTPVTHFKGAKKRLSGIDMLVDFPWTKNQAQFTNGQNISAEIKRIATAARKAPAMLLTSRQGASHFQTDHWYVVPVCYEDCIGLSLASIGAFGYVWRHSILDHGDVIARLDEQAPDGAAIANLFGSGSVTSLVESAKKDPTKLANVLEAILGSDGDHVAGVVEAIRAVGQSNPLVGQALAEMAEKADSVETPSFEGLESGLRDLSQLRPELVKAFADYLNRFASEGRTMMVREVVDSPEGIHDVNTAFSEAWDKRIEAVTKVIDDMEAALDGTNETFMQNHIEKNPWLLGFQYARVAQRREIGGGMVDFLLQRYDGGYDIVELKGPEEDLIIPRTQEGVKSPPPNKFHLGDKLSNALAQALTYKTVVRDGNKLQAIRPDCDARIVLIVGREGDLQGLRRDVFDELKRVLKDVEIVPYDQVVKRARQMIENVKGMTAGCALPPLDGEES